MSRLVFQNNGAVPKLKLRRSYMSFFPKTVMVVAHGHDPLSPLFVFSYKIVQPVSYLVNRYRSVKVCPQKRIGHGHKMAVGVYKRGHKRPPAKVDIFVRRRRLSPARFGYDSVFAQDISGFFPCHGYYISVKISSFHNITPYWELWLRIRK